MTSPVSLEALLRRMSRDGEKIFNECGEVPMLWLLETADGEQKMLTTPLSIPPGMSPGDYKHHLDASLHDLFAREHVVRWSPGRPVRSWRFHYVAGIGRFDDGRLAEVLDPAKTGHRSGSLSPRCGNRRVISSPVRARRSGGSQEKAATAGGRRNQLTRMVAHPHRSARHSTSSRRCHDHRNPLPIYLLTLQAMPGAAGIRALRWVLKVLLRKYKLRCVSIEELTMKENRP